MKAERHPTETRTHGGGGVPYSVRLQAQGVYSPEAAFIFINVFFRPEKGTYTQAHRTQVHSQWVLAGTAETRCSRLSRVLIPAWPPSPSD